MPLPALAALIPMFAELAGMLGTSGAAAGTAGAAAGAGTAAAGGTAAASAEISGFAKMAGTMGELAAATQAAQGGKGKTEEDQQARETLKVGQQSVGSASKAIGGLTSTIGQMTGSLTKGAILGPAGATVGALAGFVAADKAIEAWTNSLLQSQQGLADWSAGIAFANTQMQYQSNLMDIERGQRTGESYKYLTESRTANEQAWLKWEAAWTNFSNFAAGIGNYIVAGVGVVVENFPGVKQALDLMAAKQDAEASQLGIVLSDIARGNNKLGDQKPWKVGK